MSPRAPRGAARGACLRPQNVDGPGSGLARRRLARVAHVNDCAGIAGPTRRISRSSRPSAWWPTNYAPTSGTAGTNLLYIPARADLRTIAPARLEIPREAQPSAVTERSAVRFRPPRRPRLRSGDPDAVGLYSNSQAMFAVAYRPGDRRCPEASLTFLRVAAAIREPMSNRGWLTRHAAHRDRSLPRESRHNDGPPLPRSRLPTTFRICAFGGSAVDARPPPDCGAPSSVSALKRQTIMRPDEWASRSAL